MGLLKRGHFREYSKSFSYRVISNLSDFDLLKPLKADKKMQIVIIILGVFPCKGSILHEDIEKLAVQIRSGTIASLLNEQQK